MAFKKIKKETLSESIINQITDLIRQRELKLGDRLPSERALAELLGVSRPPVREALHALAAVGLIEVRSGEGTFLRKNPELLSKHLQLKNLVTRYDTGDLVEARRILEIKVVGLAAVRRSPEILDRMGESIDKSVAALAQSRADIFLEADFEFHMLIAKASGNRVLEEMMWTTRDMLLDVNKLVIRRPGQMESAVAYHRAIMRAVVAGQIGQAEDLMNKHLDSVLLSLNYVQQQDYGQEGGGAVGGDLEA